MARFLTTSALVLTALIIVSCATKTSNPGHSQRAAGVALPTGDPLLQAIEHRFGRPDRVTGSGRLFLHYDLENGDTVAFIVGGGTIVGLKHDQRPTKAELEAFKKALIAYIDEHPGHFIGRAKSDGLRDKSVILLESKESPPTFALEEFVIFPDKMRFQANYGVQGPEPYLYEGEFAKSANGLLQVANVKLTRSHVRQ